jgi:hypothetical protein
MSLSDIKRELKKLDKDKLIDLIADLYKKNKSVKEFLDFYVEPNERELFRKYREKVFESFFPKRGFGYSLKNGKQAISDYRKLGPSSESLADLMLFYVETGVAFTIDFGDIDENFYSSLESTYVQALKLMRKEDLLDKFSDRARKVIDDTKGFGWGFHDYLSMAWFDFYPDYDDDIEEAPEQKDPKTIKLKRIK